MKRTTKLLSALALSVVSVGASASLTFAATTPAGVAAVTTPGVQLRVALNQLLGEHAVILETRMQALYSGNTAQYNELTTEMNQNTAALTKAITGIYGSAAGQKFESLWNEHMYFFDYVNDVKGEQTAQTTLTNYKNQFATFMNQTDPDLSASTLSTVLQDHINQITTSFNDYAAGNDSSSVSELETDYNLMFTAAGYLANGIVQQSPSKFDNGSTTTAAVNLQSSLDQLLGEHAMILELAMQALYSGNQSQYNAYMSAMTANTTALTQAITSVYGTAAGQKFESLWNEHKYFFTYVNDVKAGNTAGAAAAQTELTNYKNEFAEFMASANPNFSESTLSTVLQEHIDQITTAFQDYVAGNYQGSEQELATDYSLMYTAGAYLSKGIVAQFPSKFNNTSTNTPAGNLRISLDQLLGQHALILELRMQALYSGNTNLYNAYTAIMNQNTASLTQAITSLYGTAGGQKFESLWDEHMYFFTYVQDMMAANSAQATLTKYKNEFAQFMASANPDLSEATLSSVLQEHINQITTAFNDYTAGNYTAADSEMVDAYNLMYTAGDYLATGIEKQMPSKFNNTSPNTPSGNLVSTLDQLLGIHAFILELRMQAQYSGNTQATNALATVMNQNTQELTQAIGSVYGSAAAAEFEKLWNDHMYFFTYVNDVKSGDTAGAQQAQATLTTDKNQFAAFMAKANPNLSESTLSTVLQDHINQITTAFLDSTKGNYSAADPELLADYNLMYTAGQYLAEGIVDQFPSKFSATSETSTTTTPKSQSSSSSGSNSTSMMKGATSPVTALPLLPIMAGGAALAIAGAYVLMPRRQ